MPPSAIEQAMPESVCLKPCEEKRHRFPNLRGVQWRIDLGILPSPSSSSVDDLRRVTANSRRRYAGLRRRLLVDPHLPKDGSNSPNLAIDNPLSQNPDSTWGRLFRNAELEKTVDQDLTRLYPEHGSYFQTPGCQGMLRRILLLWCLRHPEYGYRQGMHELLAPLLYVLHVDVDLLSEVRKQYEDHFTDKFDDLSFHENDLIKKYLDSMDDETTPCNSAKVKSLDDLDPEVQTIVLLSDAYGAEGELGIVLSEKFTEHDAYCMFDSLMNGANGVVAMAGFFSPPVLEASNALYYLLAVVDSSLHSHLVELSVEPQYFALRWFRVLFGREFSLQNLLIIWDEIFAASNSKLQVGTENDSFYLFTAPRGAFIAAIAVSIILSLRSSLLATENATTCLQRLLNLPENVDLNKLINKAKSLQALALGSSISSLSLSLYPLLGGAYSNDKSMVVRRHTLSFDSTFSPRTPLNMGPGNSYWEEKWRVLHKAEEHKGSASKKQKKGWSEKVKWTLSRTESDPSPTKVGSAKKNYKSSTRQRLLDDLSRELGLEDDSEKPKKGEICAEVEAEDLDSINKDCTCTVEDRDSVNNDTEKSSVASNLSIYQTDDHSEEILEEKDNGNGSQEDVNILQSLPKNGGERTGKPTNSLKERKVLSGGNNQENDTEKSSVASNLSVYETDDHSEETREENDNGNASQEDVTLPVSHLPHDTLQSALNNNELSGKSATSMKERKLLQGKFQWFWKFGRTSVGEETAKSSEIGSNSSMFSAANGNSKNTPNGETADQNVMGTLRNLGHSMLEHIQAIESVFQQDRGQENFSKNVIVGKGQVTAMTALTELRKISNLLSEM